MQVNELEKYNSTIIIVEILIVSQTCRVLLSTIFLSGLDVHFKGDWRLMWEFRNPELNVIVPRNTDLFFWFFLTSKESL